MNKTIVFLLLALFTTSLFAVDKSLITKEKYRTPFELYLDAQEAYDMKMADPDKVLLLDVRSQAEIRYTGIADIIDANIPYRFDTTAWKTKKDKVHGTFKRPRNPDFAVAVENVIKSRNLTKDSPVIIMCTSGGRAPFAARILHKAGFTNVYTQIEGFEGPREKSGPDKGKRVVKGWKLAGLPWSYKLVTEKMYFNFDPKHKEK
ncbi:MAG: rhodanese-like domain-containing protein [Gammaproteobacteria bacterium]|nr:rhodanese-like domain-containing protein [Gammaproteobacteria bacterium]